MAAFVEAGTGVEDVVDNKKKKTQRLVRPDDKALEATVQALQTEISALQDQANELRRKIDDKRAGQQKVQEKMKDARGVYRDIRLEKDLVMQERAALFAQRDALKKERETKTAAGRAMRDSIKYRDIATIDAKLQELNHKQHTESHSLKEEKKLLKEISDLKMSKKAVAEYEAHMASLRGESSTSGGNSLGEMIGEKNGKLREIHERLNAQRAVLEALEKESPPQVDVTSLFKARETIREQIDAKRTEIRILRDEHRKKKDEFFEQQREYRKEQNLKRKAEQEAYEQERAEREAARLEELAKQKPWLEEIALCDQLITYLKSVAPKVAATEETKSESKNSGTITLADGTVVRRMSKKKDDGEEQMGGRKGKKGKRQRKQKSQALRVSLEVISSFKLLKLSAPHSFADVPNCLEAVRAKRDYYDTLPRAAPKSKKKEAAKPAEAADESKGENSENAVADDVADDVADAAADDNADGVTDTVVEADADSGAAEAATDGAAGEAAADDGAAAEDAAASGADAKADDNGDSAGAATEEVDAAADAVAEE